MRMTITLLICQIIFFSYALWLGAYLLARNPFNPRLSLTGGGLGAYALAVGLHILSAYTPDLALAQSLLRWQGPFLFLPALFWVGAMIYLLPDDLSLRPSLIRGWLYGLVPGVFFFYLLHISLNPTFPGFAVSDLSPVTWSYLLLVASILLPLLAVLGLLFYHFRLLKPKKPLAVILVATLFFGLGAGLLLLPVFNWLSRTWGVLGIGLDLILLGLIIAVLDAFDEGEALLPDFFRAFDAALFSTLMFAGLVSLVMVFGTGITFPMLILLLAIIAAAILQQTFLDQFETWLDKVAFVSLPQLQQARAELRVTSKTLPKINNTLHPNDLSEAEFARLTRRALSHFGDLSRLATSPLTRLPVVEANLAGRDAPNDTLERAAELKSLLTESIERLKPRDKGDFGTSDEWRYYNALYFPYVVGLKPYSRRTSHNGLNSVAQQALDWFRTAVPERTLYNWQTTAAKLVAQDLRERQGVN